MIFDKKLGRFVNPNDPRVKAEREALNDVLPDGGKIRVEMTAMDGDTATLPKRSTGPVSPADLNAINAAFWTG